MAKMKEYSKAYCIEAIVLALSYTQIISCRFCGHPNLHGYCCGHCGSEDPYDGQDKSNVDEIVFVGVKK